MRHVHLIDTSIGSDNIGDEIIVSEAKSHLMPLIQDAYITTSAGHDGFGPYSRGLAAQADVIVLLGTNALRHEYRVGKKYIWYVEKQDIPILEGKVVMCGVGANRDFKTMERRQIKFLNRVLSPHYKHAVRDETGAEIVRAAGREAINTSCPTLWAKPQVAVPSDVRPTNVVFTLTKHKADPADQAMLHVLLAVYENVYFWPQQPRDLDYLHSLDGADRVQILPPNLQGYDDFLAMTDTDVTGTRLHGTIRGLHHGRRALAIAIDNRARDIGQEVGLQTLARADVARDLAARLAGDLAANLTLPDANIQDFLNQFRV